MGKALFKLSGLGLEQVAAAVSGVHRPTEVALGLAADRLFEELPTELRRQLKKLPGTVKALETVRLGLLLLHGRGGTVEHLTRDLSAAREMAGALDDLLAGHREVARLLQDRRTTGRLAIPRAGAGAAHATAP